MVSKGALKSSPREKRIAKRFGYLVLVLVLTACLEFNQGLTGSKWALRDSGTSQDLLAVPCGNGTFVAVGREGVVLTSPDGLRWTWEPLPKELYENGRFMAVGKGGIITSP